MATLNITTIPAPRVPFIDERTGLMAREWYRFFLNLFVLTGSGNNPTSLDELQIGPPSQPDLAELLIQVNQNIAPQYEDQSGDFLATLDTAQLMSMMARFENLEAAIQGAYLNPPQIPATGGEVSGPSSSTDNAIARFDGTSGKVIQNSVTTIDDTGNASGILSQQFSDGTAVTLAAGKMWYDGTTGAWNAGMGNGNITQQIGEEIFVYGKASAAITDSPLQIIYHTGVVGASGVIQFAPTIAGITDVNSIIGVATESLALNGFGRATVFGVIHGITTNGTAFGEVWADDDVIWYNPVTGNPTKVEPVAPYIKVQVGLVIKAGAGGSGSFQVGIARGSKLGGTDSNVQFDALANNNLIAYDSTAGYWKNVTASSIGLGTVTSVAALTLGTTGTDLTSTVANGTTTPVITLNVPTASASNRGALSAADWTTFNSKGSGTVTSVAQSFTGGLISVAGSPITTSGTLALTVAGTSGGIPYFSSASTWATSAALTASALVVGGGAGAAPATITTGTGVTTALGVNTGTAGAFVVNGGALGAPSSGTVTNLTGTASININGTVGATTPAAGSFTQIGASAQITSTIGNNGTLFSATTATTGYQYAIVQNTSGSLVWGIEGSGAGNLIVGDTAYDAFVRGKTGIAFSANDGAAMQMRLSSTGLAVTGTLSSTGLLSTSAASASIKPASTTNPILITASDTNPTYGMVSLNNSATATGVVGIWGGADSDLRYAVPTGGTHLTRVNNSTVTTVSSTGLAVTGTLSATGTLSSGAITSSGNSAFCGATADSWRSAYRAITLYSTGQNLFASGGVIGLSSNLYNGAALGDWTYATTSVGAVYQQSGGAHYFQCAPSGSAGTLATLTTPLIISNTGIITMSAYGAGAATFSAAGVISSVSDETWKVKDGAPVDPDAMLNKLEPGYWYYNDEKKEIFGKDRQLGFYAQNVNAAIGPEAAPEPEENKPWGYYDRSVLAVTVMSLQKALKTIELLTERITALESK